MKRFWILRHGSVKVLDPSTWFILSSVEGLSTGFGFAIARTKNKRFFRLTLCAWLIALSLSAHAQQQSKPARIAYCPWVQLLPSLLALRRLRVDCAQPDIRTDQTFSLRNDIPTENRSTLSRLSRSLFGKSSMSLSLVDQRPPMLPDKRRRRFQS